MIRNKRHAQAIRAATLLFFALGGRAVFAQRKLELFSKVEAAFKQREPAWKVEKINQQLPYHESITFRNGNRQASVDLANWGSPEHAHETFGGLVIAFDNVQGKHGVKTTLTNLGDENHMWTNLGNYTWPTIYMRKGSVVVMVFAPSVPIAKRFAQHVLEQIDNQP
ncbi:MAG TPA: hypothetical protein VHQ64_07110 [Pyrinomonadaceae bacterium]|nr:hypothetical protein [Pyrinomonadaceae bacterium]